MLTKCNTLAPLPAMRPAAMRRFLGDIAQRPYSVDLADTLIVMRYRDAQALDAADPHPDGICGDVSCSRRECLAHTCLTARRGNA